MVYIAHSNIVPQQVDSTPSSSTNNFRKKKSKDKTFGQMCPNIMTMAKSVATIVPRLDDLINVISASDKDIIDLQVKLYEEIIKIKGLGDEKIYDAISMSTMICYVRSLPCMITSRKIYHSNTSSWDVALYYLYNVLLELMMY